MHVRAVAASAAEVRAGLTADLAGQGLPAEVTNDAALVATELITNAIRHGRPLPRDELAVAWLTEDEGVLIRVTDGGGLSHPRLMNSGPEDISGRGLAIVDSLTSSWGVDIDSDRVTVWAKVPRSSSTMRASVAPAEEAAVRRGRRPI
jgi:anti-sigma regulatory factor (Ser/Thr protein kinase)